MHRESYEIAGRFVTEYLNPDKEYRICDVGSRIADGQDKTYRALFDRPKWNYTGIDIADGPNVDKVVKPYNYAMAGGPFDVIICGNVLEHVENPFFLIRAISEIHNPGGLLCLIVPLTIGEHRHPLDCWRILPDGMRYLLSPLYDILKIDINNRAGGMQDTYGIAKRK